MSEIKSILKYFLIYSVTLIYLELVLCFQINGGIPANHLFFLCFVPAQALLLTTVSGVFTGRKNIIISSALLIVLEIYHVAQLIYFKNFGSLFSASLMGMGTEAVGNFGWTLKGVIRSNLGGILLILLPVFLIGLLSFFRILKQEKIQLRSRLFLLILVIPLWFLGIQVTRLDGDSRQSAYKVYYNTLSDTDNTASHLGALTTTILEYCSSHFGSASPDENVLSAVNIDILTSPATPSPSPAPTREPAAPSEEPSTEATEPTAPEETETVPVRLPQIFEEIDLQKLAEQEENTDLKELSLFLDSRGVSYTNDYTGLFEGYNLIYICAEAFWTYAVNEQVTPTLYKMANQGIILNNYYNSFKNTTTNGEFAFATSLWPDFSRVADEGRDVGSFPQSAHCYMPMGLGDIFQGIGVPSYAYHNYYGSYYRRVLSWPNLGYTCKFYKRGMDFTSSWPASDLELMEQSVPDYIEDETFHAYYMTFSGHGPYNSNNAVYCKNIDYVKSLMPQGYAEDAYGYMAGNTELDKAMEYLLQCLEDAGKLENTVIVIAGDHYPYSMSNTAANQLVGYQMDTSFDIYKSTCIIYNAGMEENIVSDTYCSNVDILPTVLNLFGIPYDSRMMMGRDIFSDGLHKAVIYNKSFLTDLVRYNSQTGEAVWSDLADSYTEEMKEAYLETMIGLLDSEYYASMKILDLDYYLYVWFQSGLLTEEEMEAEKERQAAVIAQNALF